MVLKPCAEGEELAKYGADCSGCMTVHTFETALHSRLEVPKRKKNQRNGECVCLLGIDIGAYDTCGYMPGDIVREAIQKSWVDRQIFK